MFIRFSSTEELCADLIESPPAKVSQAFYNQFICITMAKAINIPITQIAHPAY